MSQNRWENGEIGKSLVKANLSRQKIMSSPDIQNYFRAKGYSDGYALSHSKNKRLDVSNAFREKKELEKRDRETILVRSDLLERLHYLRGYVEGVMDYKERCSSFGVTIFGVPIKNGESK